jgi:single-strand DNA-binding protein
MSEGLNRVFLIGHLGADPELRFTQGGQAVLNIRIATSETYLDKDKVRRERTEWHTLTVWGNRGEALAKILKKGARIHVEGSLRTSSYDDRDGNKRYKTEVNVTNVILLGDGRGQQSEGSSQHRETRAQDKGYGQPQGRSDQRQTQQAPPPDDGYGENGPISDVPF